LVPANLDSHKLDRHDEARAAYRSGENWMVEQRRQAERDPEIRIQLEFFRPQWERLQREAELLIQGKDPANDRIG
jgi:hypothetical protein